MAASAASCVTKIWSCRLSDELPVDIGPVVDFFGLPSKASVIKDFYVVRAIRAVVSVDTAPFTLVFGGGTALARAHKLVQRMSEDVDFKIVPAPGATLSRAVLRQHLGRLRKQVSAALQNAGFTFDPADTAHLRSRNENRYTVWHLPYGNQAQTAEGLRPSIQVELTYAPLRSPPVEKPVSSFVAEAYQNPPEVTALPCVSLTETAAEKLVSLTRRTAMELAGLSRDPDPTLVRHIFDLYAMREHIELGELERLIALIAAADAEEFRNQFPAYTADIAGETQAAISALRTDPIYRNRYDDFMLAMVYGSKTEFIEAIGTVTILAEKLLCHRNAPG